MRAHLAAQRQRLLPSRRRRRKNDHVHLDPPCAGRVSSTRVEDSAPDVGQHTAHCQVPHDRMTSEGYAYFATMTKEIVHSFW